MLPQNTEAATPRFRLPGILALLLALTIGPVAMAPAAFISGVTDYQVFASDGYRGSIPFVARSKPAITAEVEIMGQGNLPVIQEFDKSWSADPRPLVIENVPVGGPYIIRFMQKDGQQVEFRNVLVGELWVIGGQDNALGAPGNRPPKRDEKVNALRFGKWGPGQEPLFAAMSQVTNNDKLVTPWMVAAADYVEETGIPVGLLGWAWPGLTIEACFDPSGAELPRFKPLVENYGKNANRFFWYQGGANGTLEGSRNYGAQLARLVNIIRGYAGNPAMEVLILQTGRYEAPDGRNSSYFGEVREAQRAWAISDPNAMILPTNHYDLAGPYRLSATGSRDLGRRIAQLISRKRKDKAYQPHGPVIQRIEFADTTRQRVLIYFEEDTEKINLEDAAAGTFVVTDARRRGYVDAGTPVVEGDKVLIHLHGSQLDKATAREDGTLIEISLKNTGFARVSRISVMGRETLRLDLDRPVLQGAQLSYCLMDADAGQVRDFNGRYLVPFAFRDIEEGSGLAAKRGIPGSR